MLHPDKYIMFLKNVKGNDGSEYISNVKYKLQKETSEDVFLAGKKEGWLNSFTKSSLEDMYVTGDIIRN